MGHQLDGMLGLHLDFSAKTTLQDCRACLGQHLYSAGHCTWHAGNRLDLSQGRNSTIFPLSLVTTFKAQKPESW